MSSYKSANRYFRWNLLFTFLIIVFLSSPFWLPCIPAVQKFSLEIVLIVLTILNIMWLIGVINSLRYTIKLRNYANHNIDLTKAAKKEIKHLVGICIYKEPLQLLYDTIDSVARQERAKEKISMVIGMEEGTPQRETTASLLAQRYESQFERFIVTVHPRGIEGDIPGKCSNLNYAMREAVRILRKDDQYALNSSAFPVELLATTGDCDSVFGDRYFDALEEDFWNTKEEERDFSVWQSPLFYTMNTENSPFFVRVTGIMRSFFMMGYLIPLNINTMSIFSLTLNLLEKGEYTHPGYQMEDIIAVIRWSLAVRRRCIIRCIPVATLSGPTSGKNYVNEWYEWARQIRRWTIGAAEVEGFLGSNKIFQVFHYFVIKSLRLPITVSIFFSFTFIFYYGFMLCLASLYGIIASVFTPLMLTWLGHDVEGLVVPNNKTFVIVTTSFLALQYFWFFCAFTLVSSCQRVFPSGIRDDTGFGRKVLHYLLSWPTMLMYSAVELFAFLEVTIRGKDVCSHSASKKDNLVAPLPFTIKVQET